MKNKLILIALTLLNIQAFSLPTIECNEGGLFIGERGEQQKKSPSQQKDRNDITMLLEARGGYFIFSDPKMRKVFNSGGLDVQLLASAKIWKMLHIHGAVEYIERSGRSINGHQSTQIQIVPLSLGLKPVFPIGNALDYYLNIGPRFFFVHQHNKSKYVNRNVNEDGLGGFVGTGFFLHLNKRMILDLYGEYSYFMPQFDTSDKNVIAHKIQVGGFAIGGGLGYSF